MNELPPHLEPEYHAEPELRSYYPTRLEYFAGKALTGLLVGKSLKDHRQAVKLAVEMAVDLEIEIDSTQAR